MGLIAHVGTKYVSEAEVIAVPEPEFTKTWHPVSHGKIINQVEQAVKEKGLSIVNRQYSLNSTGANMFGVWELDETQNGKAWSIGLRNSMSKMFAVGICAGLKVFVCDNLAFAGDFVEFRKHTSGLDMDELMILSMNALEKTTKRLTALNEWHNSLNEFEIDQNIFKRLTFDAMVAGVFPPSKFGSFLECWEEENSIAMGDASLNIVPESLYTFHAANTRLMRGTSLFNVSDRNNKLVATIDSHVESIKHSQEITQKDKGMFQTLKEKFSGIRII